MLNNEIVSMDIFDQILNTEGVFINRDVLRPTYVPEHLINRDEELHDLAAIAAPALRHEIPSNVFIYGKSGTGKTAAVKSIGEAIEIKGRETGRKVCIVYVNCELVNTQYRILQKIAEYFTDVHSDKIPFSGLPTDEVYSRMLKMIDQKRCVVIVVLDEIDKLKGKNDSILHTLTRINSDLKRSKLSIMCISNNLRYTEGLDARIKSSLGEETLIFKPYDAAQLQCILEERIQTALAPGALDDDVIPLCAALAAQEHGDARRALDLVRISAEIAERSHNRKITRHHVRLAQNKIEVDRLHEVVSNLPYQEKLVLYSILMMQKQNKKSGILGTVTTGEVYRIYKELCNKRNYSCLTQRRVADFISELDMLGIITARVISRGRQGQTKEIQVSSSYDNLLGLLYEDEMFQELAHYRMKSQTRLI